MNISKEHNLGVQLTLFGVILTFALTPVGDRHDGLAVADNIEKVIRQGLDEGWNIGAIITDNAGQCGRARRILALRWPQLVFWLQRVRRLMKRFYGNTLGLRTLCATRWNSMQGCFASLLRVKTALPMLHHQYGMDSDFPLSLRCLGDVDFWTSLTSAENVIAPLSYASYRLQRDENTVGDVLVKCVEERWRQCEQPLFMLGFALHPAYADHARALPTTKVSGLGRLPSIAAYYYRRLFSTEDVGVIRSDMLDWMEGKFTRTKASEFKSSLWKYWRW
ncbi:uncharacterized protein PITG_01147 [Phytophthora infestans T30-4]|uniref:DUF659 domain-containing protein n=1 Tax=Phytophthora infestans (strain T30-4) TaxID=403677 RepID=D0MSL0_PHYIT|nr:uncharacterized protein PITG_01147 [Phytophthora infestans T30-4]EEY58479.1 conserved hypothetical protein [Phytophthora infestans T30-4]|eukprot:XP_002909665.1 conserved hypothetical protein [Phytophthora infestans T30-4]